ncbi:MAG: DUF2256 domain-containing protein [Cyanobium sp.]
MAHHAERATKICAVCGRPFQWRKKWKDVWEEVRYCSERCRRRRSQQPTDQAGGGTPITPE